MVVWFLPARVYIKVESRSRGWKETLGVDVDESSDVDEGGKMFWEGRCNLLSRLGIVRGR